MRLFRSALFAGAALLPLAAAAQTAPAPAASSPAVAPINFTERTLPNGLRVYAIRDTTTPNVSVQVWYDVGSKNDPAGRSGFAHMFEHLMFKATRNLVSENFDRLTEDVGGYNNASTNDDYTNYFEVVPGNHLQRILFAEAERMANLVVEPVSFASERDVVKEELRFRTLAQPYGKLLAIYYPEVAYSVHPYARPGIGSLENLESAGIEDVRAFHATYYRPDNAILVVSGNFDPAQLNAWVDQYFAPVARPDRPIPRVTVDEPARTVPTHFTVYEPNTPLPAVLISWHLPPDNDPDYPALAVMNAILSDGESSRFYETLVYRDQIAQSADSFLDTKKGPGNFVAYTVLAGGKTAAEGEAALRREIARMRDGLASVAEIAEARNGILTKALESRETAEGKASTLAAAVIIDGDPAASDKQLAAIAQVTAADVQRVARKYLTDNSSATIHYLPAEMAKGTKSDAIGIAPTVQVSALTTPPGMTVITPASAAERILPPPPGAPVRAAIPTAVEMRLANGLRVITVEKHDLPLVTVAVVATGGASIDPQGKAGTSALAAELLTKGTATRSATEIAASVEALGGSLSSDAGADSASADLTVKSDQLVPAVGILADVVQHPAFAPEEIERARAQSIDSATVAVKDPAQLSRMVASRVLYGNGPYATPTDGTPASLKAITRADIGTAYARTWRPDQSALILVGDVTPAQAQALAEQQFGGWKASGQMGGKPMAGAPTAPRVIVVDMPDAGQAGVVVARPGIARSDPRYYAASVANTILGGGFSSRLNQEIRIKRGLAYGAGSRLAALKLPGSVSASTQTKNPSAPQVVQIMIEEMRKIGSTAAPGASELETRKAVLIGNFGRAIETTGGMAGAVGDRVVQSVPLSEIQSYTANVEAVDPAAVQAAAAQLLDPAGADIVVVGDAKQFIDELRKAYPNLELIPAASLKLDTTALK